MQSAYLTPCGLPLVAAALLDRPEDPQAAITSAQLTAASAIETPWSWAPVASVGRAAHVVRAPSDWLADDLYRPTDNTDVAPLRPCYISGLAATGESRPAISMIHAGLQAAWSQGSVSAVDETAGASAQQRPEASDRSARQSIRNGCGALIRLFVHRRAAHEKQRSPTVAAGHPDTSQGERAARVKAWAGSEHRDLLAPTIASVAKQAPHRPASRRMLLGECICGEPRSACPVGTAARTREHNGAAPADRRKSTSRVSPSRTGLGGSNRAGPERSDLGELDSAPRLAQRRIGTTGMSPKRS
jgi:hypothetical protein